jgi:hypothetical protein
MDPITQRILDQQRAITQDPNFSGYQPSAPADGIAAFNSTPINQDIMFQDTLVQDKPPIDVKGLAKNVGKNLLTDFAIKKLGLDGLRGNIFKSVIGGNNLMGFSNPLTAAFTVGSLLPDSAKGLAAILRNNRAQKAIERDIIRDMQGKITTSNPRITNMQPTSQDIARGGGRTTASSTAKSSSATNPYSGGAGGLHSGY